MKPSNEVISLLLKQYPEGTRIQMSLFTKPQAVQAASYINSSNNEVQTSKAASQFGTVLGVDNAGMIMVKMDSGVVASYDPDIIKTISSNVFPNKSMLSVLRRLYINGTRVV